MNVSKEPQPYLISIQVAEPSPNQDKPNLSLYSHTKLNSSKSREVSQQKGSLVLINKLSDIERTLAGKHSGEYKTHT